MSLPDYYSRVNPDLLALIPPDAKVVLEIGCGAGALCEAYRRANPGVHWAGVESNREAAFKARDHVSTVADTKIEDVWEFGCCEGWSDFDCLVIGDVLEHLTDPWTVLKNLAQWLVPGAQVLASIPNVQHWTVIRDLLAGKWEYQDEGLLDRTHLRFFTLDSIRKMFDQAGLHIHEIRGRDLCNTGWEEWDESIDWLKLSDGVDAGEQRRRTRAYQYIVRAVKPRILGRIDNQPAWDEITKDFPAIDWAGPRIHIHAVTAEECCARPRIHEPFAAMRTAPGVKCGVNHMIPPNTDIVILQRPREPLCNKGILEAHRDKILVVELDDEPSAIGIDPLWLRAVHAVQVSTEPLAEIVRQYNPNVMVFENQIANLPAFIPDDSSGGTPNAGIFFGAQNRQNDWVPIMPAINRIANDPSVVVWFDVVHDREFFDALETDAKRFYPFLSYDQYRALLSTCDIALLPLEPGGFNECKSDIKFLECAAEGVAVLASETVYGRTIGHDLCGVIYQSPRDFEYGLRSLIRNPEWRASHARDAYAYVRDSRMLGQHFRKRLAWYQELLATKSDLTRQLLERVPELRSPQHALATTCP